MSSVSEDSSAECEWRPLSDRSTSHILTLSPDAPGLSRWAASQKATRIPLSMFHSSLQIAGMDVSQEEAECYVANMVYKGFMRGYISHEKQMVVVANTNAFPRLADRPSPYNSLY